MNKRDLVLTRVRGISSVGRAPALQAGGHRFEPGILHHLDRLEVGGQRRNYADHALLVDPLTAVTSRFFEN